MDQARATPNLKRVATQFGFEVGSCLVHRHRRSGYKPKQT